MMKAEIVKLTPELAKSYLKMNVGNRKLKNQKSYYVKQMKEGLWKENGEPIIIDSNGFVKDGQHRLHAVIEANFTYNVPVISGVDPDVMDTIDTGLNRSLGDVLELNGFKYSAQTSGIIRAIMKHKYNHVSTRSSGVDRFIVTNSEGLEYAIKNKENLFRIVSASNKIHSAQHLKILGVTEIARMLYSIAGYDFMSDHIEFIKAVCTASLGSESATYYVHKKLIQAKQNKITLSSIYKHNLIMKAWNIYTFDDQPVRVIKVQKERLEKPLKVA